MPHSELLEPKLPQNLFTTIDLAESFNRNGRAVCNARRQARTRRLVPRGQSRELTQLAHFALAHSDFDQRTPHCVLLRSLPSGTKVVEIIRGRTVNDELNAPTRSRRFELAVQLVFAEVTTICIVRAV